MGLALSILTGTMPAVAGGLNPVTLTPSSGAYTAVTSTTMTWQPSGIYPTGTIIQIDISPFVSSTNILVGSSTNIGNNGVAIWTSTATTLLTLRVATSTNSTAASSSLWIPFNFSSTSTNYSFAILTSSSTSSTVPTDFGAALFYANGGNLVTVTAAVPASLSFSIRNSADTEDTNSCSLGTLSTAATSTCSYRLRTGTNASGGFTTTILANQDFANSSYATMTAIGDNVGTHTAGTENYGISVFTAATTGGRNASTGAFDQAITEGSSTGFDFSVDPTPVPTTTAKTIQSYPRSFRLNSAPSLTTTSLVTHFANIDTATPSGFYSQVVTYLVTATF